MNESITVERVNAQFAALKATVARVNEEKYVYGRFMYTLGVLIGAGVHAYAGWPAVVIALVLCGSFFAIGFYRLVRSSL